MNAVRIDACQAVDEAGGLLDLDAIVVPHLEAAPDLPHDEVLPVSATRAVAGLPLTLVAAEDELSRLVAKGRASTPWYSLLVLLLSFSKPPS